MIDITFNFIDFWPSTINDLIFQHLAPEDVKTATCVHRSWNEFLSIHSITSWRNICLVPEENDDIKYLVNSSRRYQHLQVLNVLGTPEFLAIICKPNRKWKSIVLDEVTFESDEDLALILKAVAGSIESLNLLYLSLKTISNQVPPPIVFPRLKRLEIEIGIVDYTNEIIGHEWRNKISLVSPKLENLTVGGCFDEKMIDFIVACTELKKLSIAGNYSNRFLFRELAMKIKPCIEKFSFYPGQDGEFLNEFLASQSATLRKFKTNVNLEPYEFEVIFKMKVLESLTVEGFEYNRDLIDVYMDTLNATNVPEASLKTVVVSRVDQNFLKLFAHHARGLKTIQVGRLLASDISNPSWFPVLEEFKTSVINKKLERKILAKEVTNRSRLENLALSGLYLHDDLDTENYDTENL